MLIKVMIRNRLRNFKHKLKKSYLYLNYVWKTGDFDWDTTFLFQLMAIKFKSMADNTKDWHVVRADRDRKELITAAEICKRLSSDFYSDQCYQELEKENLTSDLLFINHKVIDTLHPSRRKQRFIIYNNFESRHPKEDLAYLLKLIKRKSLNSWWD